jgi:hypothetical protein
MKEGRQMCEITTHGYKMKDGTIIPFKKLNMGDVSPDHVEEMNRSSASVWDVILLRNTIFGMKEEIKKDVSDQLGGITKLFTQHESYCPANEERVRELVHKEIGNRTDLKIRKSAKVFDLIWKGAVVLIVVINIYLFIIGKNPIQITP